MYLSPAHHWGGWKFGCNGYTEDINMPLVAKKAASDLKIRRYKVRVGAADPDENVTRSNGWGTTSKRRHIVLHSNANGTPSCPASVDDKGTQTYYVSATGHDLADDLWDKIGFESPGVEDARSSDVINKAFYELTATSAVAAYVETEFHDWAGGVTWLKDYDTWAWRVGYAVDTHLGYPDAPPQPQRQP